MLRTYIGIVCIAVICLSTVSALADEIKVVTGSGFEKINALEENGVHYISLSELAEIIGGRVSWETVGHSVTYTEGVHHFTFMLDAPFMVLDDSTYNLTYSCKMDDGQLLIPVVTALPFLDRVTSQKLTWSEPEESLRVDAEYFNVTDMAIQEKNNGLLIEIFLTKELSYEAFVSEGNWLNVSIRDGFVNSKRISSRRFPKYVYRHSVHQIENNTGQISIRLKRNVEKWHHRFVADPPRIQISIADVNFDPENVKPPTLGPDDKIDVICVDPGHGGDDYGAVGQKKTREKDIVLKIGRKLAALIRKDKRFKVVMTRDRDEYISLEKRAEIANKAGADLFISIHANASPKKHVHGWNVFFLAPALTDSSRAVEQLENSFFLRESESLSKEAEDRAKDPLAQILSDMLQTEFLEESRDFALMIDKEFRKELKTKARGVDQAGFFVLNKVFTPSVLVESAFISNKDEEKLLDSGKYQDQVAEAIYDAIKRFKAKYEKQTATSSASK